MKKAVIISPIGVNKDIVQHGVNGLLADSSVDWQNSLELLIKNSQLRQHIANNGYKTLINKYSVQANENNFLELFN